MEPSSRKSEVLGLKKEVEMWEANLGIANRVAGLYASDLALNQPPGDTGLGS